MGKLEKTSKKSATSASKASKKSKSKGASPVAVTVPAPADKKKLKKK